MAESEEILSHIAVNYRAERGSQLTAERAGVERRELALFNESNVWTLSLRLPSGAVI
jgi:hypothetical protein